MAQAIITPVGTLSYPHFFKPVPKAKDAVDKVYSGVLLFTAENLKSPSMKALKEAVAAKAKEAFPKGELGKSIRTPFRSCEEKENIPEEFEGFISAWCNEKPGIVSATKEDVFDSADVWPGQWARFSVAPFSYDNAGNKGVSFYLHNVQIIRSVGLKRLDGRKTARDTFDDEYADSEEV